MKQNKSTESKIGLSRQESERLNLSNRGVETMNLALKVAQDQEDPEDPWLSKMVGQMRRHYDKQEEGSYSEACAVGFFIRDLFISDSVGMQSVTEQCCDWLKGLHKLNLSEDTLSLFPRR